MKTIVVTLLTLAAIVTTSRADTELRRFAVSNGGAISPVGSTPPLTLGLSTGQPTAGRSTDGSLVLMSGFQNRGIGLPPVDVPDNRHRSVNRLEQNVPNPFNPSTTISFEMSEAGHAQLVVYTVTGRVVEVLVNQHISAGRHVVAFRPTGLASGVYFYRLRSGSYVETRRMLLLK